MKKLVLVITTVALVMIMAFGVSAKSKVKSVTIKGAKKNITLTVGDKKTYTVKVKAKKGYKGFKVKSSNKKIVKVTKKGKKITIKALKKGKAKVTVTLKKNKKKKYTFTVTVNEKKNNSQWVDTFGYSTTYTPKEEKEREKKQLEAQEQKKIFDEQGLIEGEDYYFGMANDGSGMVCVLKYKQIYIDDELMADFNKDKAIVEEKSKNDPTYEINKSYNYFKINNTMYQITKNSYYINFSGIKSVIYGCYNDTGELPTPDNYDYKYINGELVEGIDYDNVIVEYYYGEPVYGTDFTNLKKHKFVTQIGYDVDGNLSRILKSPTS